MDLLSDRIRRVLEVSGENPSTLAKKIGCSAPAIQQWLSGETTNIKNHLLFALADATGFEARWIGTGQGHERVKPGDMREQTLIETYRALDPRGQDVVHRVAQAQSAYVVSDQDKKTGTD